MTQNIYDREEFFEAYGRLTRSVEGLDGAPEWPALRSLLPNLAGTSVLDLGCGYGWFCRWARENGAASVVGVDVSERMLTRARAKTADPAIRYVRGDMETFEPSGPFALAYSSLAFHYLEDLAGLLKRVHDALAPGGRLVFSVEHPVMTALAGEPWQTDSAGRRFWPIARYLHEGPRSTDWLAKGVMKRHRTIGTYVEILLGAGFRLTDLIEWGPTDAQIAADPTLAEERDRPPFLLIAAAREVP
jgi:SAM-dependent methyltransferase